VKSITDYWMTFVYEQANNRSEKGSLIHLTTNFQKQVQVTDTTQENETETNTAPMTAKKKEKENDKNKYQQIYPDKWENDKRGGRFKKDLDRTGIDNEGSLEW